MRERIDLFLPSASDACRDGQVHPEPHEDVGVDAALTAPSQPGEPTNANPAGRLFGAELRALIFSSTSLRSAASRSSERAASPPSGAFSREGSICAPPTRAHSHSPTTGTHQDRPCCSHQDAALASRACGNAIGTPSRGTLSPDPSYLAPPMKIHSRRLPPRGDVSVRAI